MAQVIQVRRRIGGGAGRPANLQPGELAYNDSAHDLFVGDGSNTTRDLVSAARQVEIAGPQTITGLKTIDVANLRISGGNPGEMLSAIDAAGNLDFVPMVSASQQFVGSLDAAADSVTLTLAAGGGATLPAAGAGNNGWYVIAEEAGTLGAASASGAPAGDYQVGDWVISNGTAWTHLEFGGIETVTAADVGVAPAVAGASNVQAALEALAAADANFVVGPAASVDDRIATFDGTTGLLIQDSGTLIADLATKAYVDTENDAQDTLIAANAAAIVALETNDALQDTAIAAAGDVKGQAAAIAAADNIAVYTGTNSKAIKDGGTTVAAVLAAIDAKVDVAGDTMTGALNLPVAMPTAATHAAHKAYVDQEILAVSGGASVLVTGPELVGTGLAGAEITFTGITTEANVFTGTGLSTDPLVLALVDGGTF